MLATKVILFLAWISSTLAQKLSCQTIMKSYYQTEDDYYKQGCDRINSEKCQLLQKKMDTIGKKYYDFGDWSPWSQCTNGKIQRIRKSCRGRQEIESHDCSTDEKIRNLKKRIIALEAKLDTQEVIFSGIRRKHVSSRSNLTFDEAIANVGQGLDPETGIFKCPVSGIYSFSFSALTQRSSHYIDVGVYRNDIFQFWIHENDIDHKSYVNLSYVWTMVLQRDDRVQLKLGGGKGLHATRIYPVWFNGQLLLRNQ